MSPDEHEERALALLEQAEGMSPTIPMRASLERAAIVHATLSLRLDPAPLTTSVVVEGEPKPKPPARKRPAKKTTKKTTSPKEGGS